MGFYSSTAFAAQQCRIVIVYSKSMLPYGAASSGFTEEIKQSGYEAVYGRYDVEKYTGKEDALAADILNFRPEVVLVLGTKAAIFAGDKLKEPAVVFSMVLDPSEGGITNAAGNMTGVSLDIPLELQFRVLAQVVPHARRIGMLYDAARKGAFVEEVRAAAALRRLKVTAKPVYAKDEVKVTLERLLREADCLWAAADSLIYNQQSGRDILLTTLQSRIPFMAFSSYYVKAGALCALECDYKDIGRQSAHLALRILRGEKPQTMPIESPRKTRLVINRMTAAAIGITIPADILKGADEIIGEN